MVITVKPQNEREEKVLRAFLDSLEYEYEEGGNIDIPAPPGAKRQTIEEYNQEIAEAEAAYKRGEFITHDDLKKEMESW